MTRNCAFGTLEEELIRDRIVCGVSSEKIKERLLRERDLTLDKAIDLCRAEEQSKTQLKCISEEVSADLSLVHAINPRPKRQPTVSHGSLPNEEAGAVKPISNQHPTSICRNCGYQHKRDKCPAFGKRCNKCHKFNHFARYCRSSKGVSTLTQKEEEEEHSDADELVVGTLNAKQTVEMGVNECFASFRVQDRVIKFKIDTSSQVNVMPLSGKVGRMDESLLCPTLRHDECSLLLSPEDPVRCIKCTFFRSTLMEQNRCSRNSDQDASHASHVNYRYQPVSTLVERLKQLRKEYRKTSFTIRRLKEKIRQSCDMQGTTVGEELHKDLKAITEMPETTKIIQDLPKDSFLSIFWQQQLESSAVKTSKNM
eukprot:Em0001g3718a